MASAVLLAALAIPTIAGEDSDSADMAEKAIDESTASAALLKNQHMAGLLGFHSNPSRSGLMSDLNARGLKDLATPEVREVNALDLTERGASGFGSTGARALS